MSETPRERVHEILNAAEHASQALVSGEESADDAPSMRDVATEAAAFLESTDPETVLEAVELDSMADGSEPTSIPDAIARGDDAHVEDLHRLVALSNLAESDADGVEEAAEELRSVPDTDGSDEATEGATDRDEGGSTDEEGSTDDGETGIGSVVRELVEDESSPADDATDVDETLQSALRSSITAFGDDIDELRDRLEAASDGGDETDETDGTDGTEGDETTTDERPAADEGEEPADSDGGFGLDFGSDRDGERSGRGVARHSTTAQSPSDRPDMRVPARLSTMPDED